MYKYIYQLTHEYISKYSEFNEPLLQQKELGYFSDIKTAKSIIEKYKNLKGFKDFEIECFKIGKKRLEITKKQNKYFYELYHCYIDGNGYEEYEYLGVFPTMEKANEKKRYLIKTKEKFSKHPNGFDISQESLDSENSIWNEGFDPTEFWE